MSDRNNPITVYVTDEEKRQLKEWSEETGKSISELSRDAIREYLDYDRSRRVEEKVDKVLSILEDGSHTHKAADPMKHGTKATEKAREIISRLQANHDPVMKNDVVERAIEDIAGADDRTLRKYKRLFRKRGLLFEHPGEPPLWTTETETWLDWMKDYTQLNGREQAEAEIEQYPARISPGADGIRIQLTKETDD